MQGPEFRKDAAAAAIPLPPLFVLTLIFLFSIDIHPASAIGSIPEPSAIKLDAVAARRALESPLNPSTPSEHLDSLQPLQPKCRNGR